MLFILKNHIIIVYFSFYCFIIDKMFVESI
jgi:hypothetical protein